jgi:cytochrome c oxidase subunit 4
MAGNNQATDAKHEVNHSHSGAKHHLWAFFLSIVLTLLAFWAVASEHVGVGFTIPFIVVLAFVQAAFQLFIWMHANQRGHQFPILFMASGLLIAIITVISFLIWVW